MSIEGREFNNIIKVWGLPLNINRNILYSYFIPFGPIKSIEVIDNNNSLDDNIKINRIGFIEYEENEDANEAITNMNGGEIMGKTIYAGFNNNINLNNKIK